MPADASIYGYQQPFRINTPFENLSQVLQLRQQQQQIQSNQALEEERRQKLADQQRAQQEADAYYQILSSPGSTDDRLEAIRRNPLTAKFYAPTLKAKLEADKSAADTQKAIDDAAKAHADAMGKIQEHQAGQAQKVIASDYNPAMFMAVAQHELELFPALKGEIGPALAQVQAAPPEQQKALVQQIMQGWGHGTPESSNAMTTQAKQAAEQPGQIAKSAQEQQVAANMQGGLTAEQRGQQAIAAQNAATSRGQLAVAQAREAREAAVGDAMDPNSPKYQQTQQKLEQQYRTVLQRTMSSRSGGLGLEDQKVNQALHLMAIFEQNKDPKTGQYTIPRVLQNELALGLARLTSPTGQVGVELSRELNQRTAQGDLAGAITYLTGQPVTGNTQAILKMFKDSIERQGAVAESNRESYLNAIRAQAPTDLEDQRRQKLEQSLLQLNRMPSSGGPSGPADLVWDPKTKTFKKAGT